MKILIVGDTHGNTAWLRHFLYPRATAFGCDRIVVLGDFGFWEHDPAGAGFLDAVDALAVEHGIDLYWLPGNHDNTALAVEKYGADTDQAGFVRCREQVLLIPNGHTWLWQDRSFRSFGGAYSVDKAWRVAREKKLGKPGSLWFPGEQMTDADMQRLLELDHQPKDVVLSHDKPLSSRIAWNRKDLLQCMPNQMRLQRALEAHTPTYWLHGHLHWYYVDQVAHYSRGATTVMGLAPDEEAAEFRWRACDTFAVLDLDGPEIVLTPGEQVRPRDAWSNMLR